MILVGQFDSPFVRRVAVTLNHYHMPFTRNPLSVFRNVAEMQKINPLVRVPALILETGEVLMVAWMNAASVVATLESGRSNRRLVHQPMNPANSMVTAAPTSSAVERVAVRSRRCTGIPFRRTLFYRPVGPGS